MTLCNIVLPFVLRFTTLPRIRGRPGLRSPPAGTFSGIIIIIIVIPILAFYYYFYYYYYFDTSINQSVKLVGSVFLAEV